MIGRDLEQGPDCIRTFRSNISEHLRMIIRARIKNSMERSHRPNRIKASKLQHLGSQHGVCKFALNLNLNLNGNLTLGRTVKVAPEQGPEGIERNSFES